MLFSNGKVLLQSWDENEEEQKESFHTLLTKHHHELRDLEKEMQCDYIVLEKNQNSFYTLLYDNRFMINQRKKNCNNFLGIILDKKGRLLQIIRELSKMPMFKIKTKTKNENLLYKLVQISKEEKNPVTYQETMSFIKKHNLKNKFNFCFHSTQEDWNVISNQHPTVEAFTKNDYSLGFRMIQCKKAWIPELKTKLIESDFELNEFQINYSSSVSVKLSGLNQAYHLGFITKLELHSLSAQLAQTIGALWIELDDKNQARFATYKDNFRTFQKELCETDEKTWTELFEAILKCQISSSEQKSNILSNLMSRLKLVPDNVQNPWKNCLQSLTNCIKETKVIVYSVEDTILHSIKAHYCYFAHLKCSKNFRGITLNSGAKHDLTMIKTKGLVFFNFGSYLELDLSDVETRFPIPIIKSAVKDLKNQQRNVSVSSLCKNRGLLFSSQLRLAYIDTGKHFIEQFNYDIFSLPVCSLSTLAFNTIWHKYTELAGIFQHGLERTKTFQENLLRKYCTGGFSYSCRAKINCGEPLHDLNSENEFAKSIREFDLISSYGYAASNMSCPTGFCTGFTNGDDDNDSCSINQNKKNVLERCDKKNRFYGFEFLSVYYTIWKLSQQKNVSIQTVYSNYHQFGYLQLGKLTLDLVLITDKGEIIIYAFDGAWAHGCRKGCPSLKSYAGNKTRDQVEMDSELRDTVIKNWCKKLNENLNCPNFATYHVIAGCHEPEYTVYAMKSFFNSKPELKSLIEGYFTDNLITQDDAIFANDSLTFLAVLHGYVPKKEKSVEQKPLFLQGKQKRWDRFSSTEMCKQGILLTRDYLNYLIKEHNFQVTKISKIYFYKKCYILPQIFQQLVQTRSDPFITKEKKQLLKNIVNYAAGFFGYNEVKHQTKFSCRLVTKVPRRYRNQHQLCSRIEDVTWINNVRIMFLKTWRNIKKKKGASSCAFPLYIGITEWGKKRLSETFCHFEKYLLPQKYRLVYSNVDNAIICLSTDTIEEAVDPKWIDKFSSLKNSFFSDSLPGHLKEEFVFTSESAWKFVSGMIQNYAILTNGVNAGLSKTSALNHISTLQAYDASCAMLNYQSFSIDQTRRTNKLAHLKTVVQTLHFESNQ